MADEAQQFTINMRRHQLTSLQPSMVPRTLVSTMRMRSASVLSDSVLYLYALLPALLILRQQDWVRRQPAPQKLTCDDAVLAVTCNLAALPLVQSLSLEEVQPERRMRIVEYGEGLATGQHFQVCRVRSWLETPHPPTWLHCMLSPAQLPMHASASFFGSVPFYAS